MVSIDGVNRANQAQRVNAVRQPRGVAEQLADGDGCIDTLFLVVQDTVAGLSTHVHVLGCEARNIFMHWVAQTDFAFFDKQHYGQAGDWLCHGKNAEIRVARDFLLVLVNDISVPTRISDMATP